MVVCSGGMTAYGGPAGLGAKRELMEHVRTANLIGAMRAVMLFNARSEGDAASAVDVATAAGCVQLGTPPFEQPTAPVVAARLKSGRKGTCEGL